MTTTDTPYSDSFEQYNSNDAFSSTANTPPPVPAQISADHIVGGTITGANWVSSSASGTFNVYIGGTAAANSVGSFSNKGLTIAGHLTMGDGYIYSGGKNTGINLYTGTDASGNNQFLATFLPNELQVPGSVVASNQLSTGGTVDSGQNGTPGKFRYAYYTSTYVEVFTGGINLYVGAYDSSGQTPVVQIGNSGGSGMSLIGNFTATGTVTGGSDQRLKTNITSYTEDALSDIVKTAVHTYNYLTDAQGAPVRVGLIAQEAPAQIVTELDPSDPNSYLGLDMMQMLGMQWRAIQQLYAMVTGGSPSGSTAVG